MSNCARSNETDLDWLARNVYVWPVSTPNIVPAGDKLFEFGATFHQDYVDIYGKLPGCGHSIYRHQWLSRRSELQNKPSWDDFGESAKFMAQDSDGAWMAFESEPAAKYHVWSSMRGWCGYAREGRDRCRGEVLGDWRDTLDRRPQAESDITDPFDPEFRSVTVSNEAIPLEQPVVVASTGDAIQGKCPNCGNTGIHACLGRKVTHTDTANEIAEWVTKQQAKETSDWHERGELPPVGAVCEAYIDYPPQWVEAEIVAHKDGFAIGWCKSAMKGCHGDKASEFRPIRTERDELVNVFINHYGNPKGAEGYIGIADAILAAGFSLGGK